MCADAQPQASALRGLPRLPARHQIAQGQRAEVSPARALDEKSLCGWAPRQQAHQDPSAKLARPCETSQHRAPREAPGQGMDFLRRAPSLRSGEKEKNTKGKE